MTLARLPRAGAISKPHDYNQKVQKWRVFWKNEIQRGNSLKISNEKKTKKNPVIVWRTEQKNHETPKAKTEHETCSHEEINWSKIEKSIQNKWRWQGYQLQAQFQSPMITNRTYKNWRAFWKNEF